MKILATIKKEFLLLTRDPGGLTLIFLMPLILVVVMALIQDNTFRGWQETKIEVLLVDEDHGSLGADLERTFRTSNCVIRVSSGHDSTVARTPGREER